MATQRSERAVDLFRQHGASEFMRKCHGRKGQQQISPRLPLVWKAVVSTDQKHEILRFVFRPFDQMDEGGRIELTPRGVEEHFSGTGVLAEQIESMRNNLAHLTFGVAGTSLEKLGGHTISMDIACFADVIEEELHAL